MHNELRYQAKTHTISEKATLKKKNKILHLLFLKTIKKKKNNKDMLMEEEITSSPSMYGKIKLVFRERLRNTKTEKQPPDVL